MTNNIDKLTSAIMNIPCKRDDESFRDVDSRLLYKEGHRDARHSAVELVLELCKNAPTTEKPTGEQAEEKYAKTAVLKLSLRAAFPVASPGGMTLNKGMTLRDYFAGWALNSVINMNYPLADIGYKMRDGNSIAENYAHCAYELADAMLQARTAAQAATDKE